MTTPQSFTAAAPLDQIARALMDRGYRLGIRDDVNHEFARLVKPHKHDPSQEIILYRCGCIHATGAAADKASAILVEMAKGGAQ